MAGSDDFDLSSDQLPTMLFYICLYNRVALMILKMDEYYRKWLEKHGYSEVAIREIGVHQKILLGKRE